MAEIAPFAKMAEVVAAQMERVTTLDKPQSFAACAELYIACYAIGQLGEMMLDRLGRDEPGELENTRATLRELAAPLVDRVRADVELLEADGVLGTNG